MNTSQPIRFRGTIQSGRKPGVLAWVVLAAIFVLASYIPVIGLVALVVFLAFFLPAAIGSFLGWSVGGARDEIKAARRIFRRRG